MGPVSTFSVGYEEQDYSELQAAAETARYLETDHEEYIITPGEYWDNLPRLVWHFDEPVADPAAIALYYAARTAGKKVTVILSGEGADEVFGGYGIYKEPLALRPARLLPRPLLSAAGRFWPAFLPGKNYLRRAGLPLEKRYYGNAFIFSEEEKRRLLKQRNFPPASRITAPYFEQARGLDEVTKMQYLDLHTWLPGDILAKADKMTMASSVRIRVPYLDHRVFEVAATIPLCYKIRRGMTKYLLRRKPCRRSSSCRHEQAQTRVPCSDPFMAAKYAAKKRLIYWRTRSWGSILTGLASGSCCRIIWRGVPITAEIMDTGYLRLWRRQFIR